MDERDRETLLALAEFLGSRGSPPESAGPKEPKPEPRPPGESVVGAIKRLSRTYYMLDRSAMLNETSSLMAAHVVNGRPAAEVVGELEAMFERYYSKYRDERA
jgi:hypothetical protein